MPNAIENPQPNPATVAVMDEPRLLSNQTVTFPAVARHSGGRATKLSLLVAVVLASLPLVYAGLSTMAAQQSQEQKNDSPKKETSEPPIDEKAKDEHPAERADSAANLTIAGPVGLKISLDSPVAILSRAKELGLDDKQKQELEKLDQSARDQARGLLSEQQRQQISEIPPEWLAMMQMAQLQDMFQQMLRQTSKEQQARMGPMPMGQGGQMQNMMPQMMEMMRQMGQGGGGQVSMGQGGQMQNMMPQMMNMMRQMMGQGGGGQMSMGQGGMMCPMMGQGGSNQSGSGQDMMSMMMNMMSQMMGQAGMGQGGMGQGGQMSNMMPQMMEMMRQMMGQGGSGQMSMGQGGQMPNMTPQMMGQGGMGQSGPAQMPMGQEMMQQMMLQMLRQMMGQNQKSSGG